MTSTLRPGSNLLLCVCTNSMFSTPFFCAMYFRDLDEVGVIDREDLGGLASCGKKREHSRSRADIDHGVAGLDVLRHRTPIRVEANVVGEHLLLLAHSGELVAIDLGVSEARVRIPEMRIGLELGQNARRGAGGQSLDGVHGRWVDRAARRLPEGITHLRRAANAKAAPALHGKMRGMRTLASSPPLDTVRSRRRPGARAGCRRRAARGAGARPRAGQPGLPPCRPPDDGDRRRGQCAVGSGGATGAGQARGDRPRGCRPRTRRSSRRGCTSGIAMDEYADDHDGCFPRTWGGRCRRCAGRTRRRGSRVGRSDGALPGARRGVRRR